MRLVISPGAWRMLAWLGAVVLIAAAIGAAFGRASVAVAVALVVWIAVYVSRLLRFESWLRHRSRENPPDVDGVWGDIIAIVHRVYRRKQFHKERVVSLLREFRRLTSAMPDGAVLLNTENEIDWFNQRAAEWLNLKRKRDFGFRIENLVRHPDFIDYLRNATGETAGEPRVIPMPGAAKRWVAVSLVYTPETARRLLIVREVTHQVQLETMRKEFVANASHELRSPLTVISGYLDALGEDDQLADAWRAPVDEMRRQAERMRGIIDDLLELSRLESNREPAPMDRVDVCGLLSVLRKDVLSLASRPKTMTLQFDSDAKLLGSERELASVFGNLVDNAVKYTPPEGAIEIRWLVDHAGGHVSVRDTGIGIAPEHIARLTERFYRVDAGRSREMGGSGLGLAIVKHALQRHDATLSIDSAPGKGSTFTCHFPLSRVKADKLVATR
jgi:two-component system, OmpR family, phosphate regulon sensor histidine kinase PhoR